jgi:hypothetical protein
MNAKSNSEKARINMLRASGPINALKNNKGMMISAAERELVEILSDDYNVESQFILKYDENIYLYDVRVGNKLIEYNGDYWHCNPNTWTAERYNKSTNCTAKEKWQHDRKKITFAESKGYEVLIIWESEWKCNKETTIKKCKRFIDGN